MSIKAIVWVRIFEIVQAEIFNPIFIIGDLIHKGIQNYLELAKERKLLNDEVQVEVEGQKEVEVNGKKVMIRGRLDILIKDNDQLIGYEIKYSRVYEILAPYERIIKLSCTQALKLEVVDYHETILEYYKLAYDRMLHNKLEDCAKYVGIMLTLMLKAKGYSEELGPKLISILERLDWSKVKIYSDNPEKFIDYWLSYKPRNLEDFAYAFASIALSLLEQLPSNSFIRMLHTPILRELYLISLIIIVITSTYFIIKRAKSEIGGVEYEGYR